MTDLSLTRSGLTARSDNEQHHGAHAVPRAAGFDRRPDDSYALPCRLPSTDRLTPRRTLPSVHEGSL